MKNLYLSATLALFTFSALPAHAEFKNKIQLKNIQLVKEAIKFNKLSGIFGTRFRSGFTDGNVCATPFPISTSQIDPHRSLLVHDAATLSSAGVDFSLEKTLGKIATQVASQVPSTTAESIFKQMWDTQNSSATVGTDPTNIHCDDNSSTINGFPQNNCPRAEGQEALAANLSTKMAEYKPVALVNRIDLAHKGWKNCGEHRIIYGKGSGTKNLMIFEAVLPNPKPGCRSGCRDVIEFWANLSNDTDPDSRAVQLQDFFYNGLPNFSPVVHVNHYNSSATASFYGGSDSGQIRTNQFLQGPWLLKEFKTLTTCAGGGCEFDVVPISVKGNPYGELWNKDVANSGSLAVPGINALATAFQAKTLNQVTEDLLGNPDINAFSYAVDANKNAADSNSQGSSSEDNYQGQLNLATDLSFKNSLDTAGAALTIPLTSDQIANRATALSCAGCHMPNFFGLTASNAIGPGQSWPNALAFVHVDTNPNANIGMMAGFDATKFNGNTNGSNISPALLANFLPTRGNNLVNEYNKEVCNCQPSLIAGGGFRRLLPEFKLKKSLVDSAVKELVNPRLIGNAKAQILAEDKRITTVKKLSKKDFENSFKRKREVIKNIENAMTKNPSLQSMLSSLKKSNQVLEKVNISKEKIIAMSRKEKSQFKIKLANDLVKKFPQRETVTNSFRTH